MFVTHNDAQIYSVSFGKSSRTILSLGGWAGSWELWAEPFNYLSETWRTIAFDHRGAGATIAPVETITIQNMVDDVFAILDTYQIEQCVLAAESMGAVTAFLAALQQPHRFQGLVIVDGLISRPAPTGPDPFVEGLRHNFEATIAQFVDACLPEQNSTAYRRWGRQILARSSQLSAIQLYECIYGVDLNAQIPLVTLPTLVLHGELDTIVPVQAAKWLVSNLPNARLKILLDAGHVPTVTRPREVSEAINHFFEGASRINNKDFTNIRFIY